MDRRSFLKTLSLAPLAGLGPHCVRIDSPDEHVMTVRGPVPASTLGRALSHEHILVDFIGAEQTSPDRYRREEVFEIVLPYLRRAKEAGCQTFFDFTPAYLGRDPLLLRRLSEAVDLHIVTNAGYYGARNDLFLPDFAHRETADELAARWTREFEEGIGDSGVKLGFLKIGVDPGPLSETHVRLIRAAARAHASTGLTIAVHTGPAEPAFQQLAILQDEGIHPSAWIWVHSQNESNVSHHTEAASRGAWVAFDGLRPETADLHLNLLRHMKSQGLLHRTLLSHDAGWYSVGEDGGGSFRGYDYLFTSFLDMLRGAGFSEDDIGQLLIRNPAEAFTIRKRTI